MKQTFTASSLQTLQTGTILKILKTTYLLALTRQSVSHQQLFLNCHYCTLPYQNTKETKILTKDKIKPHYLFYIGVHNVGESCLYNECYETSLLAIR